MARVTVEDCIDKVTNRFELVMLAAHRAREIASGMPMTVEEDNDKNPVIALREIAEETVKPDEVRESLIRGMQKHVDFDEPEPEEEPMELLTSSVDEAVMAAAAAGLTTPAAAEATESPVAESTDGSAGPEISGDEPETVG